MYEPTLLMCLIFFGVMFFTASILTAAYLMFNRKRSLITERLQNLSASRCSEDLLDRPFLERSLGLLAQWLVKSIDRIAPHKAQKLIAEKLEKAGHPYNLKAKDFLAIQGIIGSATLIGSLFVLPKLGFTGAGTAVLTVIVSALAVYLPWFVLAQKVTKRQKDIRRNLPDIMDLLVVSVEAGLAFDMALLKVVERFQGYIAQEFQQALREMQLGKARKDALKDMAERVDLPELSVLVNVIIQSEQLGVGLGNILRMQSDLIREKRQNWIEEQAMKAPIKMLFPIIFFIFPCIFIILLGPAVISIMRAL